MVCMYEPGVNGMVRDGNILSPSCQDSGWSEGPSFVSRWLCCQTYIGTSTGLSAGATPNAAWSLSVNWSSWAHLGCLKPWSSSIETDSCGHAAGFVLMTSSCGRTGARGREAGEPIQLRGTSLGRQAALIFSLLLHAFSSPSLPCSELVALSIFLSSACAASLRMALLGRRDAIRGTRRR